MESVERIRKALGIKAEAVGVKYTDEPSTPKPAEGKYTVCSGMLEAADGKVIMLSKETCPCPGGQIHLGLAEAKVIPLKFLVEGEKLWYDVKAATRARIEWQKIAPPPLGIAGKVYLYPLSRDVFVPDLVIFLVNAEQVSRLVTLAQFWDGKTPSFEMRGALCWSSIAYPMVSGHFNITAGDISARKMAAWNENAMVATVPVEKVQGIADAIDKSTAGTAKPSEDFEKIMASIKAMRNK
ncbi:MAG: DUF169 domain-containing protein [Dehalococcoidia bacterium]|nr:DUF169 domain-containing protein [Dehalococcoidia bacterium]